MKENSNLLTYNFVLKIVSLSYIDVLFVLYQ